MNLSFIDFLVEDTVEATQGQHILHPEDAIFTSSADALRVVDAVKAAIGQDGVASIKWDGGIALFFGYTGGGEFFVSDKYMYPAGFYAKSPADWQRYDTQIKSTRRPRPDLYPKIAAIWEGLQSACGNTQAIYKGDLMAYGTDMEPKNGEFVFKPTTVTYEIPVKSSLGKLMAGKIAMVVVHTMNNKPWDGKTGLTNSGNVAIFSPNAGNKIALNIDPDPKNVTQAVIKRYGQEADSFLGGLNGTLRGKIKTYFNKKITGQTNVGILQWAMEPAQKLSRIQQKQFPEYLEKNASGYNALRTIWNSVYQLKLKLTHELEGGVGGFKQTVAGNPGGEGFVLNTDAGLIKLVNRGAGGFGAAHFSK
jgi:hypothetical protein